MASKSQFRSWARFLKSNKLIDYDLRRVLTPTQRGQITRLYNRVKQFKDSETYASIKVPRHLDTGNRFRVKDVVFIHRDGASRIRYNKKTKYIVKSITSGFSHKIIRDPINPQPMDIDKAALKLRKNEYLLVRNSGDSGTAVAARSYDAQQWLIYKQQFRARFLFGGDPATDKYKRHGRINELKRKGYSRKEAEKLARQEAREIMDGWYVASYEDRDA